MIKTGITEKNKCLKDEKRRREGEEPNREKEKEKKRCEYSKEEREKTIKKE